jgi:hypothetical protein
MKNLKVVLKKDVKTSKSEVNAPEGHKVREIPGVGWAHSETGQGIEIATNSKKGKLRIYY